MGIVLRRVKGTSLTYEEMDSNFSQFAYSGSISREVNLHQIYLYYTGSAGLGYIPRSESIDVTPFPFIGEAEITGSLGINLTHATSSFSVSVLGDKQVEVNSDGIIVLSPQASPPTAVSGGIYYGVDNDYYLGFY